MQEIRVGLILSGGVSLGSYEGGVIYELLYALEHREDEGPPIKIDVIAGASAGAMTGALLSQILIYNAERTQELRDAWVSQIDLTTLMHDANDGPVESVFSAGKIDELAGRLIAPRPGKLNPHPAAPDRIALGFTLTSLNGHNYSFGYRNRTNPELDTTVFTDEVQFEIVPGQNDTPDFWERVRTAALGSGAFPLAFPKRTIFRNRQDYPKSNLDDGSADPISRDYVDGGIFHNEPIRLARKLSDRLEASDPELARHTRVYILVDPYLDQNSYLDHLPEPFGLPQMVGRTLGIVMGQSQMKDWIGSRKVDQRLDWFQASLPVFREIVDGLGDAEARHLAGSVHSKGRAVADHKARFAGATRPEDIDRYYETNLERIADRSDIKEIVDGMTAGHRRELTLDLVFLLENIAGLREKRKMPVYIIAPESDSLAGNFMANFGGFFAENWRSHDFTIGRRNARDFLKGLADDPASLLGVSYHSEDRAAYTVPRDLSKVTLDQAPAGKKRMLASFLTKRAGGLVDDLGASKSIRFVVERLLMPFVMKRFLKR